MAEGVDALKRDAPAPVQAVGDKFLLAAKPHIQIMDTVP